MIRRTLISTACLACLGAPALAEMEFSFYTGWQTSPHSRVTGDLPGTGTPFDALIGWEGRSAEMPPYYGLRGTLWRTENLGFGLEFTHAKVYAPDSERAAIGFDSLELTDGLNILTFNTMYRWPEAFLEGRVTPYVGGGLGVAIPHVDAKTSTGFDTFEYQLTGPAARVMAGASYEINDRWAVFGEYQFTASQNSAELEGDGSLDTRIFTNAINVGVSLKF